MLASKFIETELNAYITDQRLIPQDNLVRLIAKAFEAYDQYRRLVSTPECSCKRTIKAPKVSTLHPRINERLDRIDANLHACPDLDQSFEDLNYGPFLIKENGQNL